MKYKFIGLVFIGFLCGCAGESDSISWKLSSAKKTELDESHLVLRFLPTHIKRIDENTIAAITNRTQLSWYDLRTGKNTDNYNPGNLDMDSLLNATYNNKYKGSKKYVFDSSEAAGIGDTHYQIGEFYEDGENYYVYFNFLAEVVYNKSSSEYAAKLIEPSNLAILKKQPDADIHFSDFVQFMVILNKDHSFSQLIPLYKRSALKQDFASWDLGFAAYRNNFYVPLAINVSADQYTQPFGKAKFNCLSKMSVTDSSQASVCLTSEDMDHSRITFNRFLEPRRFQEAEDGIYMCNGHDIVNVLNKARVPEVQLLDKNEWITEFYIDKRRLLLRTYHYSPKKNPSDMDKAYGLDSVWGYRYVFINRGAKKKQIAKIENSNTGNCCWSPDRIVYFERDKEHYYLSTMTLDEN